MLGKCLKRGHAASFHILTNAQFTKEFLRFTSYNLQLKILDRKGMTVRRYWWADKSTEQNRTLADSGGKSSVSLRT
jgi:hypothetical protein